MNCKEIIKCLKNSIDEKGNYCYSLPVETTRKTIKCIKEKDNEIERLNNVINELKEWFKGYHKSYASCKWYEEDYIEFIEHLEEELKGEDKE